MDLNFIAALASIGGLATGIVGILFARRASSEKKQAERIALAFVQAIRSQATSLHEQLKNASNIQNTTAFPELRTHVVNSTHAANSLVNTIASYEKTL